MHLLVGKRSARTSESVASSHLLFKHLFLPAQTVLTPA